MLNKSDNTTHKSDLTNGKSDPFRSILSYGIWSVYTVVVWVYGLWSVIY